MKKATAVVLAILCNAAMLMAAEDWRGDNRLAGVVVDKATGKAVPGAVVKLRIQKGERGGPDVKGDANGKWAMLGMAAGGWNLDVSAPGYETRQISVAIVQGARIPTMKIELQSQAAAAAEAPAEAAKEEVKIGGQVVSKDIADAVEAGNTALNTKNYKDAVANYEKASAAMPSFMPIKIALARSYYGNGDLKKAIIAMGDVYNADAANTQSAMLYANMLLEDGQVDKGKEIIEKLPAGTLTDPTAMVNIGIVLMNKKQPAAAFEYFSKAIDIAPKAHEGYYYRGLASIQMGKAKQAKPDLDKVIELAPDSPEAKEAHEYLKAIK